VFLAADRDGPHHSMLVLGSGPDIRDDGAVPTGPAPLSIGRVPPAVAPIGDGEVVIAGPLLMVDVALP